MKLPVLVKHYAEHCKIDNNLNFIDFITDHYRDGNLQNNDNKHHNLPFKSHECQHMTHLLVLVELPVELCIQLTEFNILNRIYSEQFDLSAGLSSIWQPPQLV